MHVHACCDGLRIIASYIVVNSGWCLVVIRYRSRTRGTGRFKVEIGIRPTDRTLGLMDWPYSTRKSTSKSSNRADWLLTELLN